MDLLRVRSCNRRRACANRTRRVRRPRCPGAHRQRRARTYGDRRMTVGRSERDVSPEFRGSDFGLHMEAYFRALQSRLCDELAAFDGKRKFHVDSWDRPGGGGGHTATIADGDVFEKGGVNWSAVSGEF